MSIPPAADSSISQASALEYWSSVSASVDGMLGGIPQVSRVDLQGSANFLAKLRRRRNAAPTATASSTSTSTSQPSPPPPLLLERAVDCGAGIGRITKGFLANVAHTIDIVEPVRKFTDAISLAAPPSPSSSSSSSPSSKQGRIGTIYNTGLESWHPDPSTQYDLIWNQWCLGQLTDAQLTSYLKRVQHALKPGGWIVVKENMSTDPGGADTFDEVDSSVTRAHGKFLELFQRAALRVVAMEVQRGFPRELFPVRMYALQPL